MKNKKGFTLIELLAVIVILGILLSISIVAVNKIRKNQEEENRKNVISGILTGTKEYASDNNVLNNLPKEVLVSDLKSEGYVDFDEIKYSDFLSKKVYIESCGDALGLKLKYSFEGYNDCGCELQPETGAEADKICEN